MTRTGRLLFPALRWADATGFDHERDHIERALRIGVGGFTIFGGIAAAVRELIASLRTRSATPLLIASDLERGAGQQFRGATQLPPLAALGHINDVDVTAWAAAHTAQEARDIGVDWILAPVADVDLEPRNPIVGTRAFGADPERVAAHVAAWVRGARAQGALCCAKHFPGHGRTTDDSHTTLPRVAASRSALDLDLLPFRAAIDAGVDAIMTAHVVYGAIDDGTAATTSRRVVTELLRDELGFTGIVATDALNMAGVLQASGGTEADAAMAALNAGCDALLYPTALEAVAEGLERAAGTTIAADRLDRSLQRIDAAAARAAAPAVTYMRQWTPTTADSLARQALVVTRGAPRGAAACALITIDDDLGGPHAPPSRAELSRALREAGVHVHEVEAAGEDGCLVVAVYSDIRAWKGRPGLSQRARELVRAAVAIDGNACIVFFGHPRLTDAMPGAHVLAAWGGEAIMQRAAAHWLAGHR